MHESETGLADVDRRAVRNYVIESQIPPTNPRQHLLHETGLRGFRVQGNRTLMQGQDPEHSKAALKVSWLPFRLKIKGGTPTMVPGHRGGLGFGVRGSGFR